MKYTNDPKYGKAIACRLTVDVANEIERIAKKNGTSKAQIVKALVLHAWPTFPKDADYSPRPLLNE